MHSIISELDKISTIFLPPEDSTPENVLNYKTKENPYFNKPSYENIQHRFGSMIKNYQQIASPEPNRFIAERDMLSSQYSSVASTIVQEKPRQKELSPDNRSGNSQNRNFIIRKVSQKKRGGKNGGRVFPTDFFRIHFSTIVISRESSFRFPSFTTSLFHILLL